MRNQLTFESDLQKRKKKKEKMCERNKKLNKESGLETSTSSWVTA